MNMNGNIIVSIDGNIGSGKSSIIDEFKKSCSGLPKKIVVLDEPLLIWSTIYDINGKSILCNFYIDQHKYAFSFQILALSTRIAILKKAIQENTDSIIITERSIQTDRYVFAQMLFDDGKISVNDFNVYKHMYETFVTDFPLSKMIYINTTPSTCLERIHKRSREGESSITLDYLEQCSRYHTNLITHTKQNNTNILEIDGNKNIELEPSCINNACAAIYAYILNYDTKIIDHISNILFEGITKNASFTNCRKLTILLNTYNLMSHLDSVKSVEATIKIFVDVLNSSNHDKVTIGLLEHGVELFTNQLNELKQLEFKLLQQYAKKTVLCGNY